MTTATKDDLDPEAVRRGATIRAIRDRSGIRVGQLAKAVGKSYCYISNVEAGRKMAPTALCISIAKTLDVPLAAIILPLYDKIADAS